MFYDATADPFCSFFVVHTHACGLVTSIPVAESGMPTIMSSMFLFQLASVNRGVSLV